MMLQPGPSVFYQESLQTIAPVNEGSVEGNIEGGGSGESNIGGSEGNNEIEPNGLVNGIVSPRESLSSVVVNQETTEGPHTKEVPADASKSTQAADIMEQAFIQDVVGEREKITSLGS